jgi:hypothetical protein
VATLIEKPTRRQRSNQNKASEVLGQGVEVAAYRSGVGKARMTKSLIVLVAAYIALSIALFARTGKVNGLFIFVLIIALAIIWPRRGIAVTRQGLVILKESVVQAKPKAVILSAPLSALITVDSGRPSNASRHVWIDVIPERIHMKRSCYEALRLAAEKITPISLAPEATWQPDPLGRFQFRYWDGYSWTDHVAHEGTSFSDPLA